MNARPMTWSQPIAAMALIGLLITSALHLPAAYADNDPGRLIVTQGIGEVKAYPDSFEFSVSVESQQESANKARETLSQTTQRVISAIKGLGISNLDIRTESLSLNPVQDYQQGKLPKTLGYRATNSVQVTAKRLGDAKQLGDIASKLTDASINAGATNVGGIRFFIDDMTALRHKALEKAYDDARQNADVLAKAAHVSVSGVYMLEGSPSFNGGDFIRPMPMMAAMREAKAATPMPVEVGESSVTCTINAKFTF